MDITPVAQPGREAASGGGDSGRGPWLRHCQRSVPSPLRGPRARQRAVSLGAAARTLTITKRHAGAGGDARKPA